MKMKKTRKIILYAMTLILLVNIAACSSPDKANQNINPVDVLKAVMNKLDLDPEDIGVQYYSEGDEDHVFDEILLRMMFPPGFIEEDGADIEYTMDLFTRYAIVQYERYAPEIFEIGIFKLSSLSPLNDVPFKNNLKKVENMCKERIAKVKREIFEYAPGKAYYADNTTVGIFDNYVYYIVAEKSETAYETVKSELLLH